MVVPVVPRAEVRLATLRKLPPRSLRSFMFWRATSGSRSRHPAHRLDPAISGALLMHPNTEGSSRDMKGAAHCESGGRF